MHPLVARRVFYSVSGFGIRRRMLDAARNAAQIQPADFGELLKVCSDKAGGWEATRNLMVHGDVMYVAVTNSKFFGKMIVVDGKEFLREDMPETRYLTIDQLRSADENFGRLAYCLLYGLNWDHSPEKSPLQYRELIDALPSPPHASRLDPNFAKRFRYDLSVSFHR